MTTALDIGPAKHQLKSRMEAIIEENPVSVPARAQAEFDSCLAAMKLLDQVGSATAAGIDLNNLQISPSGTVVTKRQSQSQDGYDAGSATSTASSNNAITITNPNWQAGSAAVDMRTCAERWGAPNRAPAQLQSMTHFARMISLNQDLVPMMGPSGASEAVPTDGGYALPTQYSFELLDISRQKSIVQPRCRVENMKFPQKIISLFDDQSHANNTMYGGLTMTWQQEGDSADFQLPKLRQVQLNAKLATMLIPTTNQLLVDQPMYAESLPILMANAFGWNLDRVCLVDGVGAGQPLAVMNCPSTITFTRTTTGKIVWDDIVGMFARLHPNSFSNSVWVAHQSTLPQLLTLSVPIGVAGSYVPVMSESNGTYRILGREVLFTEKVNSLGSKGDFQLIDFSQYVMGIMPDNFRLDNSSHLLFKTNETVFRLVARVDGQGMWSKAFQPAKNAPTQSWAVVLSA
jgi:HK97 family phage major capsid protein